MNKRTPILIDVTIGLLLSILIIGANKSHSFITETVSLKTYDLFSKIRNGKSDSSASQNKAALTNKIQIVEIDDNAVTQIGRWPWPRTVQAQLIDELVSGGATVIGLNIFYSEKDQNEGIEKLTQLQNTFSSLMQTERPLLKKKGIKTEPFDSFMETLSDMGKDLNGDGLLAQSIEEATKIILPMYFQPGDVLGNELDPLPSFFVKNKMVGDSAAWPKVPSGNAATLPLKEFSEKAISIGHSNLAKDIDGTLRRIAPVMRYGDAYYPSFGVQLIRESLMIPPQSLHWDDQHNLVLKSALIPVDEEGKTFIEYAGPAGTFKSYSALDVLTGALPEGSLNKKIVLVGVTATGNADTYVIPGGQSLTGLEIWANHLNNILSQHFITRPTWANKLEWGMIGIAFLIICVLLPLVPRAQISIPVTLVVLAGFIGTSIFLFLKNGFWISPAPGALLLTTGFGVWLGKRLIFTEKGKEFVEAEGVETNKMLGLSFQGQGMLDLAFEKFRKCPVDHAMKELLYNLALDMERKRQFSKAAAVYEHIATADPKYKDIQEKIEVLKKAGDGAVFGGLGKKGSDATVVVDGLKQNATLGRYEVMKEIGRGAMGIVYLGKDPKINRQVAIKTLRFEDNVDEEQTKSVKERFFREAESAGNLTHPNIIRIFDAGEDQDVAYIAMELLEGEDLKKYTDKSHLFTLERTLDIVAQIADGLDYAHKQGVVHRDIKPGNIMLLKDNSLRITDFGIARIQASSKTATGAVLGTPAYMSPEQVNGKKVDGRADIFSLGVTLYELLTGEKPFQAESIAALLYRIANVEYTDPKEYVPSLPNEILPILKKSLAKNADDRYQTAGEMCADIRECIRKIKSGETTSSPSPVSIPNSNSIKEEKPKSISSLLPKNNDVKTVVQTQIDSTLVQTKVIENSPEAAAVEKKSIESVVHQAAPGIPQEEVNKILNLPPFSNDFISELEETFNVQDEKKSEQTQVNENPIVENNSIEKTVVMEPIDNSKPVEYIEGIDFGFQPPFEGDSSIDEKKS